MRATNTSMWRDIFIEDMFVVEGMQKAVIPANMMEANSRL
jgi:hypothetical protein